MNISSRVLSAAAGVSLAFGAGVSFGQQQATTTASPNQAPPSAPADKHAKPVYTGPKEIIVLPQTPVVDEAGRQLNDPDGKPVWNPAVKQQRDKNGHPLFDSNGKPVWQTADNLGFDEKGKTIHAPKVKEVKPVSLAVTGGLLEVDGFIARKAINFETAEMQYLYIYTPGVGTAVVSSTPFPGSTEVRGAIKGKAMTLKVGEHEMRLSSDSPMLGKEKATASLYVVVNPYFSLPTRTPSLGYGSVRTAPYAWPTTNTLQASVQTRADHVSGQE